MAVPKVFISSTCYDLAQIRDSLFEFIQSYHYEPVLSEKGDVFYHPDLHTHESCINEIENCQLFVLVIGGRFGGKYKFDTSKSITNAEYEAARIQNIPVLTFIKREVYEDHRVYQSNKGNTDLIDKIKFPSIDKQEYAIKIFEFIDRVRLSDVNNGFFPFEYARDIKDNLGKQWAGLMFNFLTKRIRYKDEKIVGQTLDNLTLINRKTEELVENIYKHINPKNAQKDIDSTDRVLEGAKFINKVMNLFSIKKFKAPISELAKITPNDKLWFEYLNSTGEFILISDEDVDFGFDVKEEVGAWALNVTLWIKSKEDEIYWGATTKSGEARPEIQRLEVLYESFKLLGDKDREKAYEITTANN